MAIEKKLNFYLGETWVISAVLNNAKNKPLNLANATISFLLTDANWTRMLTLNTSPDVVITNAVGGSCVVTVSPGEQTTANVVDDTYRYEIQATLADGTVTTQCVGDLTVSASLFNAQE